MEDTEPSYGVEVILDTDLSKHPSCIHGPTLLFERFFPKSKNKIRRFYACSYSRNRKICNFFQFTEPNEQQSNTGKSFDKKLKSLSLPDSPSRQQYESRYKIIKNLPENHRKYCHKCDKLLLPTEWKEHTIHAYLEKLALEVMMKPTMMVQPKVTNQSNAQYFFTDKSIKFVAETIKRYNMKRVMCIGAPTIHHCIANENCAVKSLLMDIDSRFVQFNMADEFCHYNLFNHHFFDYPSSENFENFISCEDDMTLIIDPPFGGLVDVIAHTINKISLERRKKCPNAKPLSILWFFPYFNEDRVVKALPELKMMDYKVAYSNHTSYKNSDVKKKGSPVRIFTNLDPEKFVMPAEEQYRFCETCHRYVAAENKHCKKCQACTSKDGSEYKHCNQCERCVKGSRVHCVKCDVCALPNHECGKILAKNTCHICGKQGHKRKECTSKERFQHLRKKKRKT